MLVYIYELKSLRMLS